MLLFGKKPSWTFISFWPGEKLHNIDPKAENLWRKKNDQNYDLKVECLIYVEKDDKEKLKGEWHRQAAHFLYAVKYVIERVMHTVIL